MFRKFGLPILALAGFIFAVWVVIQGSKPQPVSQPIADPSKAPYSSYIAGAGIVEAETENINVGTPLSGVAMEVFVEVGNKIKKGDPLFKLDDRNQQSELAVRRAAVLSARESLTKLLNLPRAEDVPPAKARVQEAKAALADAKSQLSLMESVTDKRAISKDDLNKRRYAVQTAQAKLDEAQAQLNQLKAGSWKLDINIAEAALSKAMAELKAMETEIERLTVRSPIDGEVLQLNIRVGEFAQAGNLNEPLMIIGNLDKLHVRIDIDENDAWRFKPESPAIAYVRGNSQLKTPLVFKRVEPFVVPKKSLTGDTTERVDTRVLQVIYSFERSAIPIYVGQQMDVFIEADPIPAPKETKIDTGKKA